MVASGSALCWWIWRKLRAAAETRFLCLESVSPMLVDLLLMLFFCVSRKSLIAQAWRKTLAGES